MKSDGRQTVYFTRCVWRARAGLEAEGGRSEIANADGVNWEYRVADQACRQGGLCAVSRHALAADSDVVAVTSGERARRGRWADEEPELLHPTRATAERANGGTPFPSLLHYYCITTHSSPTVLSRPRLLSSSLPPTMASVALGAQRRGYPNPLDSPSTTNLLAPPSPSSATPAAPGSLRSYPSDASLVCRPFYMHLLTL